MFNYPELWQVILTVLVILLLIPEFRDAIWTLFANEKPLPIPDLINPRSLKRLRSLSKGTMSLNTRAQVYYGFPYLWKLRWVHLSGTTLAVYNKQHEYLYGFDTRGATIEESRHENTLKLVSKSGILRIRVETPVEYSNWLRAIVYNNQYLNGKEDTLTAHEGSSDSGGSGSGSGRKSSTSVADTNNGNYRSFSDSNTGITNANTNKGTSPAKKTKKV